MTDSFFFILLLLVGIGVGYLLRKFQSERHLIDKTELENLKEEKIRQEEREKQLREKLATQKEEIQEIQKKFSDEFKVLANEILEDKSKRFTEQNKKNIEEVLKPLDKDLTGFKDLIKEVYEKEGRQRFSLEKQIEKLNESTKKLDEEAQNLTKALKGDTKQQGDWGEMILERILEMSGLQKDYNYSIQETIQNEEGKKLRPDVIIRYPNGQGFVIDSKVSLNAYERYVNSETDEEREKAFKEHRLALKNHIDQLSRKDYASNVGTLDFTMMFIPIEPAYLDVIRQNSKIWDYAYEKKIILISPTNLVAALKLIEDLWKKDSQDKNAERIAKMGGDIYDNLSGFLETFMNVGKSIKKSDESFEQALKKLKTGQGNLIDRAEKMKQLGIKAKKEALPVESSEDLS